MGLSCREQTLCQLYQQATTCKPDEEAGLAFIDGVLNGSEEFFRVELVDLKTDQVMNEDPMEQDRASRPSIEQKRVNPENKLTLG